MYLAPINYDRFFERAFSDLNVAKQFLEDLLNTKIETIELLSRKKKITEVWAKVNTSRGLILQKERETKITKNLILKNLKKYLYSNI